MPSRAKKRKNHDLLDEIFDDADGTQVITEDDTKKQIEEELAKIREEIAKNNNFESVEDLVAEVISKLNFNEIALNIDRVDAGLEISKGDGSKPILKFNESPLTNLPQNGAFEFNDGNLYFTSNGVRTILNKTTEEENILDKLDLNEFVRTTALNDYAKKGDLNGYATLGSFSILQSSIRSLQTNMKQASLALESMDSDSAKKLLNGEDGSAMTLNGGHNIVLNSSEETNITLPVKGTLATIEDLSTYVTNSAFTVLQDSVTALKDSVNNLSLSGTNIADGTITGAKIAEANIENKHIKDIDASKITTGTIDSERLPARNIADISGLQSSLDTKLTSSDLDPYAKKTDLAEYTKTADLNNTLLNYTTNANLNANLANYATNEKLNDYATKSSMTEIDTKIANMQVNLNALQNSDSAKKLLNGENGAAMTLSGDHNITLNAAAETNLTLPSSGTLATKEDLSEYAKAEALAGFASQASVNNLKKEMNNGTATIKDKSLTASKLADNTVTGSKIKDKTLTNNDFADNANLHGNKLKDKSLDAKKIVDNSITGSKIKDKSLTNNDFADNANLHGNKLKDKSVHGNKIVDGSIHGSKIQDKTITNNDIADNANIHGNKLKDKSVHGNKIVDGSIHGAKIQDKTITNNDIADNANIHGNKLKNGSITADKLAPGLLSGNIEINSMRVRAEVKKITSNYTVTSSDAGKVLEVEASGNITITLPKNLSANTILEVINISNFQVNFEGNNCEIQSKLSKDSINIQFGEAHLRYRGSDKWYISGDLD
ncbi:MAG: hypothetical protein HRT47_11730 [Candidatus Caenarcaniphilales bacterium]|nr:hypothetical protein [Candidatus Caenarcaniphilales bacterium]